MNVIMGPQHQDALSRWFNAHSVRIAQLAPPLATFIGVGCEGELAAVVAYSDYRARIGDVQMHWASVSPRWARPRVISACLRYAFVQLACQRITGVVAASNQSGRRFALGLGMTEEGFVRRGFGDDDAVIYGLLIEEAGRWLKPREMSDGQGCARSPACA